MDRPGTRGGIWGSGQRTASGMRTGMATSTGMPPGTARPGTRGGATGTGVALQTAINVADRPITQQGLGGMRLGTASGRRQVLDKSYYLGLLRTKINELKTECARLQKDIGTTTDENAAYLSYEKRAEALANELKDLQGELGDYNTLCDKLNTDADMDDVEADWEELKHQNNMEEKTMDNIFAERHDKEEQIKRLEEEMRDIQSFADSIVSNMEQQMRRQYDVLRVQSGELEAALEAQQQQLEALVAKEQVLEHEVAANPMKQEAVQLYGRLHELEGKKRQLQEEMQSRDSPQEERERLLQQVKEDNQGITQMERQIQEIKERSTQIDEDIAAMNADIEDSQSERNQKLVELKKREQTMDEFLSGYDETKKIEEDKLGVSEQQVVTLLETISRGLAHTRQIPNPSDLATVKDELNFKSSELAKSQTTTSGLAGERQRCQAELDKMEQLEPKLLQEMTMMKKRLEEMRSELVEYRNTEGLRADGEVRKQKLVEDKVSFKKKRDALKAEVSRLSSQYELGKHQLNDNETFTQLNNLERRWQTHENNNQTIQEFISAKTMESDVRPLQRSVGKLIHEYNKTLQDGLARGNK